MPVANTADNYSVGGQQVDALYAGDTKVWPPVSVVSQTIQLTYFVDAGDQAALVVEGDYTVDWGDGSTVEPYASGATASHAYATAGTFAALVESPSITSYVNNPAAGASVQQPTTIVFNAPDLKVVSVLSGGPFTPWAPGPPEVPAVNPPTSVDLRRHLTGVNFEEPVVVDTCANMFMAETSLNGVTGSITSSDFSNMFYNCVRLTTVPTLDTSSAVDFDNMFAYCIMLETIPLMDTSSGARFDYMFVFDFNLVSVPALDMSSGTVFEWTFGGCLRTTSILASGLRYSIRLDSTSLDAAAHDVFFTNLGTADNAAGQQVITVWGLVPGIDESTAVAKGWDVNPVSVADQRLPEQLAVHWADGKLVTDPMLLSDKLGFNRL